MTSRAMVELNLEIRGSELLGQGWTWPADDLTTWRFFNKATHVFDNIEYHAYLLPTEISELLLESERNLIIQAGGNAGLYPKQYSNFFKKVVTFEPDTRWFTCLINNVPELNVFKYQACLGEKFNSLGLDINPNITGGAQNLGAIRTVEIGSIPQLTIDSLNMNPDLIHLDIEGYEGVALSGSLETIKRALPMIVIETNNLGEPYGWPDTRILEMLSTLDYVEVKNWHHDKAFKHRSKI